MRGKLRVYLRASPGVVLSEAHRRKARGTDVVIGTSSATPTRRPGMGYRFEP